MANANVPTDVSTIDSPQVLAFRFVGSLARWGLTIIATYFVNKGIITDHDAGEYITAGAMAIVALAWSLYQKYQHHQTVTQLQTTVATLTK